MSRTVLVAVRPPVPPPGEEPTRPPVTDRLRLTRAGPPSRVSSAAVLVVSAVMLLAIGIALVVGQSWRTSARAASALAVWVGW